MPTKNNGIVNDVLSFLNGIIPTLKDIKEIHVIDETDPDEPVKHIYTLCDDVDCTASDDEDAVPFADDDVCPYDGSCDECPYEKECADDILSNFVPYSFDDEEDESVEIELYKDFYGIPDIDHVVFSGPATIVFWEDKTKTVVKCMKGEKFERYAGFAAACMKKMFGSTSRAKAVMEECTVEQPPKLEKKRVSKPPEKVSNEFKHFSEIVGQSVTEHECIQEAVDEALGT